MHLRGKPQCVVSMGWRQLSTVYSPPKTGLKSELLGEKQNKTNKHLTPADVKTNELFTIQPKND